MDKTKKIISYMSNNTDLDEMTTINNIPIELIQIILTRNQKLRICEIWNMLTDFNRLVNEGKLKEKEIYPLLANKYLMSKSRVRMNFQYFLRPYLKSNVVTTLDKEVTDV